MENDPSLIVNAHDVDSEWDLGRWVKRLPALKVKSRQVQWAGDRGSIDGGRRKEAAIQLAILVGANTIDRQQLAATIHHQDGHATWPGEAHRAVGEFYCGEEALSWHVMRLEGECGRELCERSVELRCQHLAQTICLGFKGECSDNRLKEAHHNRASRLGVGEPA